MGILGAKLWKVIEQPQGEAYISDAIEEQTDADVIREAEVRLEAANRVVRTLRAFLKKHRTE